MVVARHYVVTGRVQGVGFRLFAEHVALRENLSGYVRNLADGRVEAQAEGDAEAVERFEMAIRQGPGGAWVRDVEVTDVVPSLRATGFLVR